MRHIWKGSTQQRARDGQQERGRERWRTAPCGRPSTVLWRPLTVLWEILTVLWKTSVSCDGRHMQDTGPANAGQPHGVVFLALQYEVVEHALLAQRFTFTTHESGSE